MTPSGGKMPDKPNVSESPGDIETFSVNAHARIATRFYRELLRLGAPAGPAETWTVAYIQSLLPPFRPLPDTEAK